MTHIDGNTYHALGLEESILSKGLSYPRQPTDSAPSGGRDGGGGLVERYQGKYPLSRNTAGELTWGTPLAGDTEGGEMPPQQGDGGSWLKDTRGYLLIRDAGEKLG